ncbi:MAG TPA: phage holin family protein [Aeromicrobium sp.]|nr:phage holin family protein [Aeromicrobium sp.]
MATEETDLSEGLPPGDLSVGQLMIQLSDQTSRLIRDEMQLARVELKSTVKQVGLGAGLFSAAGLLALFGVATLIATAIIALALILPLWASSLIVTAVLLITAGIAAMVGKNHLKQASPTPERTVENVQRDIREVKESRKHDDSN